MQAHHLKNTWCVQVHLLSLGALETKSVTDVCSRWLVEATSLVPLLSVLVLRSGGLQALLACCCQGTAAGAEGTRESSKSQPFNSAG